MGMALLLWNMHMAQSALDAGRRRLARKVTDASAPAKMPLPIWLAYQSLETKEEKQA